MIKKIWLTTIVGISLVLLIIFSGSLCFAGETTGDTGQAAVTDVIERIEALPAPENASIIYRVYVDAAKDAFNMLTPEQQARVPKEDREKLAAVDEAVKEAERAAAEKEAAEVAEMMSTLRGTRAGKGKDAAEAARKAYNKLTAAQNILIPNDAVIALIDAENAYKTGRTFRSGSAWYKVLPSGDVTYKEPVDPLCTSETVPNQIKKNGYYFLVVKISIGAFKNCRNLEEVAISRNIRRIGEYAFKNTPKLTKITIRTKMLKAGKIYRAFAYAGRFKGAGITVSVPQGYVYEYNTILKGAGWLNKNAKVQLLS